MLSNGWMEWKNSEEVITCVSLSLCQLGEKIYMLSNVWGLMSSAFGIVCWELEKDPREIGGQSRGSVRLVLTELVEFKIEKRKANHWMIFPVENQQRSW